MPRASFLLHNFRTVTISLTRQPPVSHSTKAHMTSTSQRPTSTRRQNRPSVPSTPEDVYVLTLKTDPAHQKRMSELRTRYFPPHLLKVDAHITLFHALPESLKSIVISDLSSLCAKISPFDIRAAKPFRMGRGVGVHVSGLAPVEKLCAELQTRWDGHLTPQDRNKFRGHYTLMNKVDDREIIDKCLVELESDFAGCEGLATGLDLWRYDRGWWQYERDFEFSGLSV
ncbi:hypothetical protein EV127DRAFT_41280 [Xylaria flabelliformis]|nr:hypothetical protein EV127DRAFT_41280 [Xylaria flabelliformis]